METIFVVNADADMHGAKKENIFIALDRNGDVLGSLFIYPFFDYDIEPEHPHNLYLHLHVGQGKELSDENKDLLLDKAIQRAVEIKREEKQTKTRIYTCFLKHQQEGIEYFLERGFVHDEGMHIIESYKMAEIPYVEAPKGFSFQSWKMETEVEQQQFIETHKSVFPRHPYDVVSLQELRSKSGWNNFTAFIAGEVVGNIMVYVKPDNKSIGVVEDLFVLKKWRGRGVGKYLLYTGLTYFQRLSIHRVQLELWSANKSANKLYSEFGFSSIDEIEIAVGRYV